MSACRTLLCSMLPPRAYGGSLPLSANLRTQESQTDGRPALIIAVASSDVDHFPAVTYARLSARTTTEAVRLIERWRPRVVAIDWDLAEFDANAICSAAQQITPGILAIIAEPVRAPPALRAGCCSILLKPLSLNLVAARLGRLCREMTAATAASRLGTTLPQWATNCIWPDIECLKCHQAGAVCFEYSSHRRSWYACLACEHVWLARHRE